MNLTIDRDTLKQMLATVAPACPTSPTLPVLGTVHLWTKGLTLHARTTDLEKQLDTEGAAAEVLKEGAVCVSLKRLRAIVAESPDPQVRLEADAKSVLTVTAGAFKVKLLGLPVDEMPAPMLAPDVEPVDLEGGVLLAALKACMPCISEDPTRFILTGVLVEVTPKGVRVVATDGRRLATTGPGETPKATAAAIIPGEAARCLVGLLQAGEPVALKLGEGSFCAFTPRGILTGKLVEGAYPNWRQVVPAAAGNGVTVDCAALAESVHRVALVNDEQCLLDLGKAGVSVSALGADVGSAADRCAGDLFGAAVQVSMRPGYLLEALKGAALYAPQAVISITAAMSPVLLTAGKGGEFRSVIMPMRVS